MASLISIATGNFTTAGTWGVVDTTSELDSENSSTAVSTSNLDSSTFTPGAITVDGLALKLAGRATSPSGTFTVTLRNSTDSTDTASVTVNISDFPSDGLGWFFFKFGSSQLLVAGKAYLVRVVCSTTGSQVTLYRNATSNNWSRKLRTTTTGAPASGDHIVVCNPFTAAGASTAVTITMDNTATTSWGPTVSGGPPQGIMVSGFATMTWGVTAATNYYFKFKGIFQCCGGGTVNVGTVGTPMPADSTNTFFMDCVSNGDSYILVTGNGTWKEYGAPKTPWALLTADVAAAATTCSLDTNVSGWRSADVIMFTPSGSSVSAYETKSFTSFVNPTLTVAALTNAHVATSPRKTYVANMTRNLKHVGASTSNRGRFQIGNSCTVYMEYAEFDATTMGQFGSGQNQGCINISTISGGSCTIKYCTITGSQSVQNTHIVAYGTANDTWTVQDCVCYLANSDLVYINRTTGTAYTLLRVLCVGANGNGFAFDDCGGNVDYVLAYGNTSAGFKIYDQTYPEDQSAKLKTGWEAGVNTNGGLIIGNSDGNVVPKFVFTSSLLWHTTGGQAVVQLTSLFPYIRFDSPTIFGAASQSAIAIAHVGFLEINGGILASSSANSSASDVGINFTITSVSCSRCEVRLHNTTFGVASGILGNFSSADIAISASNSSTAKVIADKCTFATSTTFNRLTDTVRQFTANNYPIGPGFPASFLSVQRWGGTANDHRFFTPTGNGKLDAVIVNTTLASERLTPNSATYKMCSSIRRYAVASGATKTLAVYIRKSVLADAGGANYNGNQPRLIVLRNDALGITADTVLATYASGTGSWNQISGTLITTAPDNGVLEVYVDCDGTAGWINVGEFTIS